MGRVSRHGATWATCKGCQGTASNEMSALPAGWYGLTVGMPPELSTGNGRGYIWMGLYCSVTCLEDTIPALRQQAELARELYEPVVPLPRAARWGGCGTVREVDPE